MAACEDCGVELSRFGPAATRCRRCYQRAYRNRPGRRQAHRQAVREYTRRNPDKRREWVYAYRQRIGWRVPDITELRAAIKAVEQAVAQAARREGIRGTGEQRGDHDPEW